MREKDSLEGKKTRVISGAARQRAVFQFRRLQFWKMFVDKTCGVFVADGNCRRSLKTLVRVQKIEPLYPLSSIRKHSIIRTCFAIVNGALFAGIEVAGGSAGATNLNAVLVVSVENGARLIFFRIGFMRPLAQTTLVAASSATPDPADSERPLYVGQPRDAAQRCPLRIPIPPIP